MNSDLTPAKAGSLPSRFRQSQDLQFVDIWRFILRHRYILIAGVVVGAVIGFIVYARAPRLYTSTATVEMNRDATSGLGLQDLSGVGSAIGIGQEFMTDMLTEQAVLSNSSTALSVIENLNLMSTPPYSNIQKNVDAANAKSKKPHDEQSRAADIRIRALNTFKEKLVVGIVKNTRLLTVSYTDPDPVRSAQVANAVVDAYLTNHTRTRFEATSKASTWLTEQLNQIKQEAENTHHQVVSMERDSGLYSMSLPSGGRSTEGGQESVSVSNPELAKLMALNQSLDQAELSRIQQGAIYHLAESNDPNVLLDFSATKLAFGGEGALTAGGESMQLIQNLRTQEAGLKLRIAAEKVTYGVKSPAMQELQNQLDSIHTQISEELGHVRSQAKKNYDLAQANEDAIRKEVDAQQQKVSALGNKMADLAFLQEEEITGRKLYQDLYARLEEADIAAGVRSSGIAVVDPARQPSNPSSPVLRKDVAAGAIIGLVAAFVLGIVIQLGSSALNIPEEFEAASPYPLLGTIPGFEIAAQSAYGNASSETGGPPVDQAWIVRAPKSRIAEAYRQVRTSILLSRADQRPKVILFTSPVSGDGKSTTAYNLAVAFAAQTSKVIIIDADMRRSALQKISGAKPGVGLSNILAIGQSFEEVVQTNPNVPNLSVLVAGHTPPDPSELLGSQRFVELIRQLREKFDYVIIDAPPALLVTDPIVAATAVDAVVAVFRAGKTTRPSLRRFWAAMDSSSARILGFIVNDFKRSLQSYGYGYEGYKDTDYDYYMSDGGQR